MKKILSMPLIALLLLLLLSGPIKAVAEGVGMVTGSSTGTYITFGRQIAEAARSTVGLDLWVKESAGSIENIRRLISKENAALGIVQSDVLGFMSRSDKPRMKAMANRLRLVFPLYKEEVHLFARKNIGTFSDLEGRRFVIGRQESGNWLTATNLLQLTGVRPGEQLLLDPDEAITAVLTNKADAMIYVVGKPAGAFQNLQKLRSNPKYSSLMEEVHFVPLTDPAMLREYVPADISSADYGWVEDTISTIAVKAVLISFNFSTRANPYYRQRCDQLAQLGLAMYGSIDQLKRSGHPKWEEVDLDAPIGIWEMDTCARRHRQPDEPPEPVDIEQQLLDIINSQRAR